MKQRGGMEPAGRRVTAATPRWFVLGLGLLTVAACGESEGAERGAGPGGGPAERAIPVSARIAAPSDLQVTLRGSTNLLARESVEVLPRQGGFVSEILVEEGTRVSQGQVLARLDDEQWTLQALQAEAQARASSEAAVRARALAGQELLSAAEVESLVSDSAVAASQLELAELSVRNARILSPIAGIVTHRYIERGQQITATSPAFAVADVDLLEARLAVPEREAPRVEVGQEARILIGEGNAPVATGRVDRIRPVVDPGSGTVQVTVTIPADQRENLRPGQFVNVDIVTDVLSNRVTVPRTTVLVDGAEPRVFILQNGRAVERTVVLGFSRGDQVQLDSGVVAGDTVVIVGQDNLRPDVAVRLMELDGSPVQAAPAGDPDDR